jgi:hypothetical protein
VSATPKELREAFIEGAMFNEGTQWPTLGRLEAEAKRRYPSKRVVRPREVEIPGWGKLRVKDEWVEIQYNGHEWIRWNLNPRQLSALMDLLTHPTEEVEVDE